MTWWPGGNSRRQMGPQAREAQRADRKPLGVTRAGVGPAPGSPVVQARQVIISGSGSGWFIYDGAPGHGNIPIAYGVSDGVTTDLYGNALPSSGGVTSRNASGFSQLLRGLIEFGLTGISGSVAFIGPSGSPGVEQGLNIHSGTGTEAGAVESVMFLGDSGAGGTLTVSSGSDGNTYDTMHLSVELATAFTVNSTSPQVILSAPVAAGIYDIEVWFVVANTVAADVGSFAFTGPAAAANPQLVDFTSTSTGTGATVGYAASSTYTQTFTNLNATGNQLVYMRATADFTAAGTLAITGKETVAGNTITVFSGSKMVIAPHTGTPGGGGGGGGGGSSNLGYKIVNPSGDTSGVTDANAIMAAFAAIPARGGVIWLTPGLFYVKTGVVIINAPQVKIKGILRWASTIIGVGSGDVIRMFNPTYGGGGLWGGGVEDITLDGTDCVAPANLLHIGDGEQYELNVAVQNNTGAGSVGVHFDNTIWWTEKCHGTIFARNCTTHVMFDVTDGGAHTATNSYGYLDLTCYIYVQSGQDGVTVNDGAYPYHGRLVIKGNLAGTTPNAALRLTGTIAGTLPQAGFPSSIYGCDLYMQVETGSTPGVYTIYFNTPGSNTILACRGILDFTQGAGAFTSSNVLVVTQAQSFWFTGVVAGDFNLSPNGNFALESSTVGRVNAQSFISGSNGNVFANSGDFFKATLSANITIDLAPVGPGACAQGGQRKTIILTQAAAGGPFTVTWPDPASPTQLSPAIRWAGGVAPVMTAAAGATDVYKLETYEGSIWWGEALQNVS